jgi:hypothetical protein
MKRWLSVGFIAGYLGLLSLGLVSHTVGFGTGVHPMMYYLVWDMFCGWSAYDSRLHIIAEGDSRKFYELTPTPWGELHPWGHLGREHYDMFNSQTTRIAENVLKHTAHEPISRIYVVEECWAKKYNLPDAVWNMRYDEAKDPQHYYRLRSVILADSMMGKHYANWLTYQTVKAVADNPRLQLQSSTSRPMFYLDLEKQAQRSMPFPGMGADYPRPSIGAPSAD